MNRATYNFLNQLESQLRAMHQPHECHGHELATSKENFDRQFESVFSGDEQPEPRLNIYRELDESGHGRRDFE